MNFFGTNGRIPVGLIDENRCRPHFLSISAIFTVSVWVCSVTLQVIRPFKFFPHQVPNKTSNISATVHNDNDNSLSEWLTGSHQNLRVERKPPERA